jgi:hypothetical protein
MMASFRLALPGSKPSISTIPWFLKPGSRMPSFSSALSPNSKVRAVVVHKQDMATTEPERLAGQLLFAAAGQDDLVATPMIVSEDGDSAPESRQASLDSPACGKRRAWIALLHTAR